VEIQNGQSFVVSGLLDHRTTGVAQQVPGIGDSFRSSASFFRSKNVSHSVVELVNRRYRNHRRSADQRPGCATPTNQRPLSPDLDPKAFDEFPCARSLRRASLLPQRPSL